MINVAIDGPASSGKSTVAKAAAKALGFIHVDTGALYRTVALGAQRCGAGEDKEKVIEMLKDISVDLRYIDGAQAVFLDDEDVTSLIRTPEISMLASTVSAIPEVREYLLDLQREIARNNNVIMDGRDIATIILPDADVKIFLYASPEARADRRYKELIEKGESVMYEDVLADIKQRDWQDTHREIAPLKPSEESVMLDTTELNLEESIQAAIDIIKEKID